MPQKHGSKYLWRTNRHRNLTHNGFRDGRGKPHGRDPYKGVNILPWRDQYPTLVMLIWGAMFAKGKWQLRLSSPSTPADDDVEASEDKCTERVISVMDGGGQAWPGWSDDHARHTVGAGIETWFNAVCCITMVIGCCDEIFKLKITCLRCSLTFCNEKFN